MRTRITATSVSGIPRLTVASRGATGAASTAVIQAAGSLAPMVLAVHYPIRKASA